MIYVGIDVAKDKHDCCIISSEDRSLRERISVSNNIEGFEMLLSSIRSVASDLDKVKVGLEATGHYSYNILGFLLDKGLHTTVINPLHTNLFRKSLSLRKTKTDKVDAHTIAVMMLSDIGLESYPDTLYHNESLKSLTRYRFDLVRKRAQLKQTISRLIVILFPELEKLVSTLHSTTVYTLLSEAPGADKIAGIHLTHLKNLLRTESHGRFGKEKAIEIREAARHSVGSRIPACSLELRHAIQSITVLNKQIAEVEAEIDQIINEMNPPILSIPGIGKQMAAMILAEIGDFARFSSPDKILAFAGMSPSTYQSGQLTSSHAKMEKRGSCYLRYALYNAAKYVCYWEPSFSAYLTKKRSEGKHYNVALSHAAKKLIRVMYALQTTGQSFKSVA